MSTEQYELRGVIAIGDVEFGPARPLRIAGFLTLKSEATLTIAAASSGKVRVAYQLPEEHDLTLTPFLPLVSTVGCADVVYGRVEFEAPMKLEGPGTEAVILKRQPTLLREAPHGRALARLHARELVAVKVLERKHGQARIALWRTSAVAVGWVDEKALEPPPEGFGTIGTLGHGAGIGTGQGFGSVTTARCPHDVPLVAGQGPEQRTVGLIRKGVSFHVHDWRQCTVEVTLPRSGLWKTHLLVLQADLNGCTLRGPPEPFQKEHRGGSWP